MDSESELRADLRTVLANVRSNIEYLKKQNWWLLSFTLASIFGVTSVWLNVKIGLTSLTYLAIIILILILVISTAIGFTFDSSLRDEMRTSYNLYMLMSPEIRGAIPNFSVPYTEWPTSIFITTFIIILISDLICICAICCI